MKLDAISGGTAVWSFNSIGGDAELTEHIQARLAAAGLLEPPADGIFGPVSMCALSAFLRAAGEGDAVLTPRGAAALAGDGAGTLFPLRPSSDLAGRIASAMAASNYSLCRHPDCVNLVYVEGLDLDGSPNSDSPNVFNDLRVVLKVAAGTVQIVDAWDATTEPGRYYTEIKKLYPDWAARIGFGQLQSLVCRHAHEESGERSRGARADRPRDRIQGPERGLLANRRQALHRSLRDQSVLGFRHDKIRYRPRERRLSGGPH